MKRLAAALAATAALAMAPAAQALTTIASVNTDTAPDGSFNLTFSDANQIAGLDGLFTETLEFSTLAGILGITVHTFTNSAENDTDITRVFLTGAGLASPLDITATAYSTDFDETYQRNGFNVAGGNYLLTIQGNPAPVNSGFTGQIVFNAATAAVPEPATWAMMMLGLGAVGFALRRSRVPAGQTRERRLSVA